VTPAFPKRPFFSKQGLGLSSMIKAFSSPARLSSPGEVPCRLGGVRVDFLAGPISFSCCVESGTRFPPPSEEVEDPFLFAVLTRPLTPSSGRPFLPVTTEALPLSEGPFFLSQTATSSSVAYMDCRP